jgi:hypothetical protein
MTALQDDIDDAEEITDLRGTIVQDISAFTNDTGTWPDPTDLYNNQSAWVRLTLAEASFILLDTFGSFGDGDPGQNATDTQIGVYSGTPGDLTLVDYNDDSDLVVFPYNNGPSSFQRQLDAGTYYIELCNSSGNGHVLVFNWLMQPLSAHASSIAVTIKDFDGVPRPIDVVLTQTGQVRQVVNIGNDAGSPVHTVDASNALSSFFELLNSGTRAATTSTSPSHRAGAGIVERKGADFILSVTAAPGGETLSVKLQVLDNIAGAYIDWVDWGVVASATGVFHMLCYPGAIAADAAAATKVKGLPLPNQFRLVITHSAGGSWTYRVGMVLLD